MSDFSAVAVAAPLFSALRKRKGFEEIGAALVTLIENRTGCTLSPNIPNFEPSILKTLSLIFEPQNGNGLSLKTENFEPQNGKTLSLKSSPPAPPEIEIEREIEKKESLSFPFPVRFEAQNGKEMEKDSVSFEAQKGSQSVSDSAPTFEEWEAHCVSIGWADRSQYEASYRSQSSRHGWAGVKSWKGLAKCFATNAAAKAAKAARFANAFPTKGGR